MTETPKTEERKAGGQEFFEVTIRAPRALPPIVGYSDSCAIVDRQGAREIVFMDSGSKRALARVVVDNSVMVDQLWGSSAAFYDQTLKWLKERDIAPATLGHAPSTVEGPAPVSCNIFRIFRVGTEAGFEGYYVSPGILHSARLKRKTKSIDPYPVCHVQMSLPLLIGLLSAIRERVKGS